MADLDLTLPREQVLRCLGYPAGRAPPARVIARLDQTLDLARALARPRGAWRELPVARAAEVGLAHREARALALGLVTLGPALEDRASALCAAGDTSGALLLDACGSAAAEEAADRLGARIGDASPSTPAPAIGCRLSPGYGGWDLAWQPVLLAALEAGTLGVSLGPGLLMRPRKSVSFAQWLGARHPTGPDLAGCAACGLPRCRYRVRRSRSPR